jgi:hypothetical protein
MFTSGTGTPEQRAEAVRGKLRRLCGSDRPIDWKGLAIIDLVSLCTGVADPDHCFLGLLQDPDPLVRVTGTMDPGGGSDRPIDWKGLAIIDLVSLLRIRIYVFGGPMDPDPLVRGTMDPGGGCAAVTGPLIGRGSPSSTW